MTNNDIIQEGTWAKYQLIIDREDFSMSDDDFTLTLHYGMTNQSVTIGKSDMIVNDDGEYFFRFDTTGINGLVTAECTCYVPDEDYTDGVRTEVNRQYLCFCVPLPFPRRLCVTACLPETEQSVSYVRAEYSEENVLYELLLTKDGEPLITRDSMYVYVLRTNNN